MRSENLNKKCPKCGCEDKHILKDSGTVGVIGGPQHKSSTGYKSKEGKYRCSACGYIFKEDEE